MPQSERDWIAIAREFERKWNFPHCLGCLDGKHVEIIPPAESGSFFYNYKRTHSMVLLAIADATYKFIAFDFGTNGKVSDGGVLRNTSFMRKLDANELHIPKERTVDNSTRTLPYVFLGDNAFPLRTDMLKPFQQCDLNCIEKKVYNYRVSRARRIVENVFGILAARFRIFHTAINIKLEYIDEVVKATVALHNYLMSNSTISYAPPDSVASEDLENGLVNPGLTSDNSRMVPLLNSHVSGNLPSNAKQVRREFMEYFNNEGQVPWQQRFVY